MRDTNGLGARSWQADASPRYMQSVRDVTTFRRYAVFWAPPSGSALAAFGAGWLGRDAENGRTAPHPGVPGIPVAEITDTPRRYGFHGTLKPPFRLAGGTDAAGLDRALAALAEEVAAFEAPPLCPARIGRFVALCPSVGSGALDRLAARCVTELDGFRAPPGDAELARRRSVGLTHCQEALLSRWGYPYVLDEFRFHLTLTGALDPGLADRVLEVVTDLTAPFCAAPLAIHEIALFGEDETGRFRIAKRYPLAG